MSVKYLTLPALAGIALAFSTTASAEPGLAGATETVTVHSVDFRGRPPFARRVETMSVSEAARLETDARLGTDAPRLDSGATETVTVRSVDLRGRPPFTRRIETMSVVEAARLETAAPERGEPKVDFRGRPPFKRGGVR